MKVVLSCGMECIENTSPLCVVVIIGCMIGRVRQYSYMSLPAVLCMIEASEKGVGTVH